MVCLLILLFLFAAAEIHMATVEFDKKKNREQTLKFYTFNEKNMG